MQSMPVVVGMEEPASPYQLIHFLNYVCHQEYDGDRGADLTVRELLTIIASMTFNEESE